MKPPKEMWVCMGQMYRDAGVASAYPYYDGCKDCVKYILAPTRARRKKQRKGAR